jgi:hypothetical protein
MQKSAGVARGEKINVDTKPLDHQHRHSAVPLDGKKTARSLVRVCAEITAQQEKKALQR